MMFANALFAFLEDRGWLAKMPCEGFTKTPYLSEAVGYPIAAVGFYTQLRYGFTLPFPRNLILLPLTAPCLPACCLRLRCGSLQVGTSRWNFWRHAGPVLQYFAVSVLFLNMFFFY